MIKNTLMHSMDYICFWFTTLEFCLRTNQLCAEFQEKHLVSLDCSTVIVWFMMS